MSTELAKDFSNIQSALSLDDFNDLTASKRFLPRVQLFGSSNKLVKMNKFTAGHYGLCKSKNDVDDLGDEFHCLPLQVRAKAMDYSDKSKIVNIHDMKNPLFKQIAERSKDKTSDCMYGPEFLLWLPDYSRFATMFFSNPTMRNAAPNMMDLLGKRATCGVRFIESDKYGGWHGPQIVPCQIDFELPDPAKVAEQIENFVHPSDEEDIEAAEEEATGVRER